MTQQGNKDNFPLFTVIIPNKNRAKYLHHTLRTCMMQNYERLEILVSDDGSTDNAREVVEDASRRDSRIRYISPGAVGMRDNFEYALRQAKSGFVIALGGDDGLLPGGIQGMSDVLRDTGMDLLTWPAPIYVYPNVHDLKGQIVIYRISNKVKIIDSNRYLCRQAKKLNYLTDFESPMFYVKGVASTTLIDRVRNRSTDGRFYSCPTPDGYSGIVLAGEVSHYAFSGKPFSIYGLSPDSQGQAYLSNDEKAKKTSEIFFQNISLKPMHRELASQPYSPLITLMTVDYLLTARDLPGWAGKFTPINYRKVLLNGIKELTHGLYGEERICRELKILIQIAEMHGLDDFFREKVRRARQKRKRLFFEGTGINTNAFLLDGYSYNLHNIFDAAYSAQNIYQVYSDLKLTSIFKLFAKSLAYRFRAIRKGNPFPPESEWS